MALAGNVHATTISGGTASLSSMLTDYNQALGSLSRFDSNLGTLNSVTFSYSYGFDSTITITAQTNSRGSVRTESAAQFYSKDSSVAAVLNSLVNTGSATIGSGTLDPAAYDLLGISRIYDVSAGQSQSYSSVALQTSKTVTSAQSSDLLPFSVAGGGTFDVFAQTLTGTVQTNTGGNNFASQRTLASQSISVSYDYTARPVGVAEPASLALLGAGMIGIGLIRRRREG